jgi:hypothetical protein
VDAASSIMRVNIGADEDPDQVATIIVEGVIQAYLLEAAGKFNQFAREMPVVICSAERLPQVQHLGRTVLTSIPMRTDDYPRHYAKHAWIEPSCFDDKGDPAPNEKWEKAVFEMAIFADPAGIHYNYVPLKMVRNGPQWSFGVSGDFAFAKDAVLAVPYKR